MASSVLTFVDIADCVTREAGTQLSVREANAVDIIHTLEGGFMKRLLLFFVLGIGSVTCTTVLLAQLSVRANQDGPSVSTTSPGTGTFYGTFSSDMKALTYRITVAKLTGPVTVAHFHFAATGAVITPITFTGILQRKSGRTFRTHC